jgi:sigma-B regulation protein RsbU (phosphoserine phosphatase)
VLVANAGHPEPLLLVHGLPTLITPLERSPPLGLDADPVAQPARLGARDRLLLYTDGLIEARRPGTQDMFPLLDVAPTTLGSGTPAIALQALRDALFRWSAGSLGDDAALLVVQPKT